MENHLDRTSIKDVLQDRKENFFLSSGGQLERRIHITLSASRFSHIISQVIERFQSRGQQLWIGKSIATKESVSSILTGPGWDTNILILHK